MRRGERNRRWWKWESKRGIRDKNGIEGASARGKPSADRQGNRDSASTQPPEHNKTTRLQENIEQLVFDLRVLRARRSRTVHEREIRRSIPAGYRTHVHPLALRGVPRNPTIENRPPRFKTRQHPSQQRLNRETGRFRIRETLRARQSALELLRHAHHHGAGDPQAREVQRKMRHLESRRHHVLNDFRPTSLPSAQRSTHLRSH